jgi:hypothetical protein
MASDFSRDLSLEHYVDSPLSSTAVTDVAYTNKNKETATTDTPLSSNVSVNTGVSTGVGVGVSASSSVDASFNDATTEPGFSSMDTTSSFRPTTRSTLKKADTLYVWDLTAMVGKDYIGYVEDIMRMVTIQVIMQAMYFMRSPSIETFFSASFGELVLYIVLGVTFYWLVVRKLVRIV